MELIHLIKNTREGDKESNDRLFSLVYEDLKKLARKVKLSWNHEYTLNTTALVHEAYIKVHQSPDLDQLDRLHFYRICGRAMRFILQDYLKKKAAVRRGGHLEQVDYQEIQLPQVDDETLADMEQLFLSLKRLEDEDLVMAQVVECRIFAEMSVQDTAELLEISPATVKRKWAFAKTFISNQMRKAS